ncbi:MAG: metallophosphoesterase [Marinibacterium sp.]|nr:metallophosphoesterase [Marinibacterium sp.]
MKLAIVTDIHHGRPHHTKRGDTAMDQMARFAQAMRQAAPDLVLDLGDRITDENAKKDSALMSEVADAFSSIDVPVHHVCGNHDLCHLTAEENAALMGQSMASEVIDAGAWNILLWRADAKITWSDDQRGFNVPEADYLWLVHHLTAADKPTLVVSHVPVSGHGQAGNYYFEANPDLSTYPQTPRLRAALNQAKAPVIWLAGHVHWNSVTQLDGIFHLTQQSLTESFTTGGAPAGAWGSLTLDHEVAWRVHGLDPFACVLPVRTASWVPPLAPFAGRPRS